MDAFFGCLPYRRKRRVHFHAFMAEIHQRLKVLKSEANPLKAVATEIAKETRVLCFDEFHVSDIADAMILGRLLENLLSEGVVLVATSNYAPSELYPQGQNRSSFLPTIALIESNLTVLNVDGGEDYRLRTLRPAEIFFVPNNEENEQKLAALFKEMSGISELNPGISIIHGREIPHKAQSERAIWFDFRALCFGPRSQADYLYLAEHYEMVFLSGLERLTPQEKAEARRLTWLIDVFIRFPCEIVRHQCSWRKRYLCRRRFRRGIYPYSQPYDRNAIRSLFGTTTPDFKQIMPFPKRGEIW